MTVWLCSGQGAQKPGMGADLLELEVVSNVFYIMSDVLGRDLSDLAKHGSQEEINDTENAQALTMAVSVGIGRELLANDIKPDAIIGFSLGQISGLVLAGILELKEATELLKVRSESMSRACSMNPGGMVALIGADLSDAEALCVEAAGEDVLVCANHNAPGQIVISGHDEALERAQAIWKDSGKKSVRLATSGAFHSPLMQSAADDVEEFCKTLSFNDPDVSLICNTDALPFAVDEASERLGTQVRSGVLFEESVRALASQGETDFVEIGFGGVLTGLVKRIDRSSNRVSIGTLDELMKYIRESEGKNA